MVNGYSPSYDEISSRIGTPAYVFDTDVLNSRLKLMKSILGERTEICYAMKANPFVVGFIDENVDKYEVCSPGEFKICEKANVPMKKIVLSGVYKEADDIKRIITAYGEDILYTGESIGQLKLINNAADELGYKVNVILRVTSGNQFGIDEDELCHIIKMRDEYAGVSIVGIQHFSGTQRKKISAYRQELEYCKKLLCRLEADYDFVARRLEFGTGFFFEYFQPKAVDGKFSQDISETDAREDDIRLLKEFKELLDEMDFKQHITLEIGRFAVASCGRYYTKIVDAKTNRGIKFCIMDGGIHQINYFGQMMGMKRPWYRQLKENGKVFDGGDDKANICGALCTINDNIAKELPLTIPEIKDIIEFRNAGAYSMTEGAGLFLSRDLPRVYIYCEKKGLQLRREKFETFELNY